MKNLENIFYKKRVVAVVIRKEIKVNGLEFFTNVDSPIQVAIHQYKKGKETRLHLPKEGVKIKVSEVHKFIYVEKGKIKVSLYDYLQNLIKDIYLTKGDGIIVMNIAHKVNFIGRSRAFEIKQGPYKGILKD